MNLALGLLIFLPFITIVISVHELSHFLVARHYGMKVTEYFVGFGPRLWSRRKGELEYGVKGLPLGGYVKIAGMNPYEPVDPSDLPRTYGEKPIWQRALTIFAGPGSHFVMAAAMFALVVFFYGNPRTTAPVVGSVDPTVNGTVSAARAAGLQPGDKVVKVGDIVNPTQGELRSITTDAARDEPGRPLAFTIDRSGRDFSVNLVPTLASVPGSKEKIGRIGIVLGYEHVGPVRSIIVGVQLVGWSIAESFREIGHVFGPQGVGRLYDLLFTGAKRTNTDPTSVIGIGQQIGATSSSGDWGGVFLGFAFITVFIGLINLVPLPPFDGGHLFVLLIEKVRGKAIDMRKLIPVSAVVMGFFIVFVAATMFLDLAKPIPSP
jgi:membrane-associated protease RseP (regulator of RpoE activity)